MSGKVTFTMIKPDATAAGNTGKIIDKILEAGFTIKAMKWTRLSKEEAGKFYEVHKERPFFGELVSFMTSGPVMLMCLQGEGAVLKNREIMGATDPKKANAGTVRAKFGDNVGENAVHGSDAPETAAVEVGFFFPGMNVYSR